MTRHSPLPGSPKRTLIAGFRANFLTGLGVVLPIGLTLWLIWVIIGWIDSWILPFVPYGWRPDTLLSTYLGYPTPVSVRGVGVVLFLIFTILVGWITKGLIGRSVLGWAEALLDRTPYVRSIYNGMKQLAETLFNQGEAKFDRACLVEYPRKGIWAVGFVSIEAKGEIAEKIPVDDRILTVFLASNLIPPPGVLLYVPRREVIMLDRIGVEDAAKLIISAGLVYPPEKAASPTDK
ncbi:MAG: DUF502 domain-containing protein [Rhodobacteraceae bacterium]|nr:DUF502 domain-containing protein [Paracoccaceae bacterium]